MKISKRERNGVTILDLEGKLNIEDGAGLLRDVIRQSLATGPYNVVANLAAVSQLDSSGMGELTSAMTVLQGHGGNLKLLSLPARLRHQFESTQIITVFEHFEDEDSAVASFD